MSKLYKYTPPDYKVWATMLYNLAQDLDKDKFIEVATSDLKHIQIIGMTIGRTQMREKLMEASEELYKGVEI